MTTVAIVVLYVLVAKLIYKQLSHFQITMSVFFMKQLHFVHLLLIGVQI